jgi:hypothetical protein
MKHERETIRYNSDIFVIYQRGTKKYLQIANNRGMDLYTINVIKQIQ